MRVTDLHGVGPKTADRLKFLKINTVEDLIYYLPREHEDLSLITKIKEINNDGKYTVLGKIERLANRRSFKSRLTITEASLKDETGAIKITWFNQPYIKDTLKIGDTVMLSGLVKQTKYGLQFNSPAYEKIQNRQPTVHVGRLVPKYPLTWGITQKQIRYFIKQSLARVLPLADYLPKEILEKYRLLSLSAALQKIHFPTDNHDFNQAQARLNFDELLILQLFSQKFRQALKKQIAPSLQFQETEIKKFVDNLPFTLTETQKKSAWEILQDLQKTHPMNRLLIGDVGCGKTVVAAMAILNTALNQKQAALMVPTEILAKQHYAYLKKILPKNISVSLWTAGTKTNLTASVVVGTHALIQKNVRFKNLGLAIVDEQHRFGVTQRQNLKKYGNQKKLMPHLLSMTATPIPRTLALASYGDLDLSIITELPKGRKPIITKVVKAAKRDLSYQFIKEHVQKKEQVFVLCPLIEESDQLGVRAVNQEYEKLHQEIFPYLRLAKLHGQMKMQEKEKIMRQMQKQEIDILIATSVIEVGIDIKNATIMLIEGAERFGLASLHQFRGRIGRSDKQAFCFLFTNSSSAKTNERLGCLVKSQNGFALAEADLKLRGAGEIYGTNQSGFSKYAIMAWENPQLLLKAKEAAKIILQKNLLTTHPLLKKKLAIFIKNIHLE